MNHPATPHSHASIADEHPPLPNLARFVPAGSFRNARIIFVLVGLGYLAASGLLAGAREKAVQTYREKTEEKAKKEYGILWFFQRGRIQQEAESVGRVLDAIGAGFTIAAVAFFVIAVIVKRFPVGSMMVGLSLYLSSTAFGYYITSGQVTSGSGSSLGVSVPIHLLILLCLINTLRMTIAARLAERAELADAQSRITPSDEFRQIDAMFMIIAETEPEPHRIEELFVITDEPVVPDQPSTGAKEITWIEDSPVAIRAQAEAACPPKPTDMPELCFKIPKRTWLADVWIGIALVAMTTAVLLQSLPLGIAAILPGMLAVVMWSHRKPAVSGRIMREGIEIEKPRHELIWFPGILSVDADIADPDNPPESFTIQVTHRYGILTIPGALGNDSRMIYRVLLDQTSPRHRPFVHPDLVAYVAKNRAVFGADKVWTTETNPGLLLPRENIGGSVAIACVVTAIVWMVIGGIDPNFKHWTITGFGLLVLGLAIFLLSTLMRLRLTRLIRMVDWGNSTLAITPLGLAMRQGTRLGKLRWDQITEVVFNPPRRRSSIHARGRLERSIVLWVEGVPIEIVDLYNESTARIYPRIMAYWQRGFAPGSA